MLRQQLVQKYIHTRIQNRSVLCFVLHHRRRQRSVSTEGFTYPYGFDISFHRRIKGVRLLLLFLGSCPVKDVLKKSKVTHTMRSKSYQYGSL